LKLETTNFLTDLRSKRNIAGPQVLTCKNLQGPMIMKRLLDVVSCELKKKV